MTHSSPEAPAFEWAALRIIEAQERKRGEDKQDVYDNRVP